VPSHVADDAERLIAGIDALVELLTPPRRPQDRGSPQCSAPELRALQTLGRTGRLTMSELAGGVNVPLSTASRIVDRLVDKELVERTHVAGDRRVVHVRFSRRGRLINRYVEDWRRAAAAAALDALPARERRQLLEALARICAAASASPGDRPARRHRRRDGVRGHARG
jgi:DNA-binding MarR family transcriptional regulator